MNVLYSVKLDVWPFVQQILLNTKFNAKINIKLSELKCLK
jgi:hypothetical protein